MLIKKEHESLNTPVAAFITFQTQEGYERACNIVKKKELIDTGNYDSRLQLLGQPLFFEEAPEPANIIWENRQISKRS